VLGGITLSFGDVSGDVYVIATDSEGNHRWNRTFGGSSSDWGNALLETLDGDFIGTGGTSSFGAGLEDVYVVQTTTAS
jgi:hypothetical protein